MKKVLSALLILSMMLTMTACTGGGTSSAAGGDTSKAEDSSAAEDSTAEESTAESAVDTSEHKVITMLVTGDVPTNKTDEVMVTLNEKINAKINAELKIEWIEWTDWQTKYNLALASQDGTVDLIGTGTDWLDTWPNAQKGALKVLTEDMLKTYAPQTFASVPAENWDLCKYNGEIYIIPEDNYAQWTNHGFMYRGDWAKAAGLTNGVHSWEDLGKYFQYIKDTMPDVIPWDVAASGSAFPTQISGGWQSSHSSNIGIEGLPVALFQGTSKDDPYTLSKYYLEGDELVNFAKTMKQWNDAGYWREDVLNYNGDTRVEMEEGKTGADQHHTQTWTGERTKMEQKQPGSDLGFFWFGEETSNLVSLNITHGGMSVAAQSDDPERALMLYDLLRNDEEIYRIISYGIEGQQYVINEDGLREKPEGYKDDTVDGVSFNFWWGRNDDLEIGDASVDQVAYQSLKDQYAKVAVQYPYGQVVFNLDAISSQLDNLSNIYNTYMPQIAFGKAEDSEAYVAEFRQALLDAGYQACLDELQSQIDAVYKK